MLKLVLEVLDRCPSVFKCEEVSWYNVRVCDQFLAVLPSLMSVVWESEFWYMWCDEVGLPIFVAMYGVGRCCGKGFLFGRGGYP